MSKLADKSKQAHAGFYLTLVSIVQSLALGFLLQLLDAELIAKGTLSLNISFQAITVFLGIILVWHEYAIGTIAYTWKLDIIDSAIPFLIGVAEYMMIAAMAIPEDNPTFGTKRYALWLWSLSAFAFTAVIAYLNQHKKAQVETDESSDVIKIPKKNLGFTVGYFVFFVLLAALFSFWRLPDKFLWIPSLVICVLFSVEAFRANRVYASV
jgi:hypothetical protein